MPGISDNLSSFVDVGQALFEQMEKRIKAAIKDVNSRETDGYTFEISVDFEVPAFAELEGHLVGMNFGPVEHGRHLWQDEVVRVRQSGLQTTNPLYHWCLHKNGGIYLIDLKKDEDTNDPDAIIEWYELLWIRWENFCKDAPIKPSSLKYIYMYWIRNEFTEGIVSRIRAADPNRNRNEWIVHQSESRPFSALLRSPNGKFLTELLPHHAIVLDRKTVECVELLDHQLYKPILCWDLKTIEKEPPKAPEKGKNLRKPEEHKEVELSPSQKKEQRRKRRDENREKRREAPISSASSSMQ